MQKQLVFIFCFILWILSVEEAFARANSKNGSAGLNVGFPKLISLEFAFRKYDPYIFGFGLGYYPINSFLQKKIDYDDIDLGSLFFVRPAAEYSLGSRNVFMRIFLGSSFFIEPFFTHLIATADISGALFVKSTNSKLLDNLITGEIKAKQNVYGLALGQEFGVSDRLYFSYALGVTIPSKVSVSADLTGGLLGLLAVGGTSTELDQAISDLETEIETEINSFHDKYKAYPYINVAIGFVF